MRNLSVSNSSPFFISAKSMKDFLEFLSVFIGRLGILGLVVALFSVGTIIAESRQILLPVLVMEWSRTLLILGLAMFVTGGMLQIGQGFKWLVEITAPQSDEQRAARGSELKVISYLYSLGGDEFECFYKILNSGKASFRVDITAPAKSLVQKNLLVWKEDISPSQWVCTLHPFIEGNRSRILTGFGDAMRGRPRLF